METPVAEENTAAGAPEGLPWENGDKPAAAPSEAGDLFAAVEKPADKPATEDAKPPAAEEGDDGFGDILNDAYGLTEPTQPTEASKPAEETQPAPEPEVTVEPKPAEPTADKPAESSDGDWWSQATVEPAAEPPHDKPAAAEPKAAEPQEPSANGSSDAELLNELWGTEDATTAESEASKPTDPPVEEAPITETPAEAEVSQPTLPLEEEPAEPVKEEPLFDEPPVEEEKRDPLPEPAAAKPQAAERPAPMAADVMKPLPAVPVLEFNTRHLAWLLGGKFGLAELADLDGATPTEVAEWRSEVARLSKSLKIADPSTGGAAKTSDERVKSMLDAASRVGGELSRAHGVDHAALMEIALKTNALLVVAKEHPDLAASVGRAVEDAADRAMLPKFLWEDSVRTLKANPDADEAHDAVVRLHQRVESFLR